MTGTPDRDLPPMYRDLLTRDQVDALFADVALAAHLLDVKVRNPGAQRAQDESPSLTEAHESLLSGHVAGVQLRYRHEGQTWFDTLMRHGDNRFLLVRVSHNL